MSKSTDLDAVQKKAEEVAKKEFERHGVSRRIARFVPLAVRQCPTYGAAPDGERFTADTVDIVDVEEHQIDPTPEEKTKKRTLCMPKTRLEDRPPEYPVPYYEELARSMAIDETKETAETLINNAGYSAALGADSHYVALTKAIHAVESKRLQPDAIALHPDQAKAVSSATTLVEPVRPQTEEPQPCFYVRGVPVYVSSGVPAGSMVVVDSTRSGFIAELQALEVESVRERTKGIISLVFRMRTDIRAGLNHAVAVVTGA